MEVNHIQKLYEVLKANGYCVLELELGKYKTLKMVLDQSMPVADKLGSSNQDEALSTTQVEIKSDKVGVFSFAKIFAHGDLIKKGEILGTVKGISFNEEIKSTVSGKIVSINIQEGEIVDYGKVLAIVEKD